MTQRLAMANGETLTYELTKKPIKNFNARIHGDGSVCVSAPKRASLADVERFLRDNWHKIQAQQARLQSQTQIVAPRDGETLRPRFEAALREVWQSIGDEALPYPKLRIRAMRSRWGSCCPQKASICLNSALGEVDEALLQYVLLHELAHFRHPNHSPAFWAYVAQCDSDYKAKRDALNGLSLTKQ